MTSIKIKFCPATSEGHEGKIYFQIIHDRIVRQWYSGYKIFRDEWDSNKSAITTFSRADRQQYLMSVREKIKWDKELFNRIIKEFSTKKESYTSDEIIEEFTSRQRQQSFFHFMESVITKLKMLGKQRTSETYTSALNSFRRFKNDEDVVFDSVDSDMMESYEAFLSKKGLIPNSISFHMRILRAVYNRAIEKGITEDRHPFRHVYTGVDKTAKRAIDINTLKQIKEVNLAMSPKADYARDMFLLSFYFRGMSFVDMAYLKKTNLSNGQITYRRRKTGHQLTVRWTSEMQEVLDKYPKNETEYLLPIIISAANPSYNQYRRKQFLINKWLKTVATHIGLKTPLTLYCSRHSWASIAKSKGIAIGVISDGLGHDSELTTQIYLSTLDTSAVDRANDLIMKSL